MVLICETKCGVVDNILQILSIPDNIRNKPNAKVNIFLATTSCTFQVMFLILFLSPVEKVDQVFWSPPSNATINIKEVFSSTTPTTHNKSSQVLTFLLDFLKNSSGEDFGTV